MSTGALDGVRILEFSIILSAPFGGMHLADMGADVIKVEPLDGDTHRHTGAVLPGAAKNFQVIDRGRRALTLDLSRHEGKQIIYRLIPTVDVVLINYRPGVAKRLGIDYETLRAIRPDLIYADIAGYGFDGPLADLPASELTATAYGGAIALTDAYEEDGAPRSLSPFIAADEPSGLAAAMGILAALFHRERTGEGQLVRASLLRSVMTMTCWYNNVDPVQDPSTRDLVIAAMKRAREQGGSYDDLIRARRSARAMPNLYFRPYRAKDGGLAIGALTPANRVAIRRVLDLEGDDQDDPTFNPSDPATVAAMTARLDQIRELLRTRTVAEWTERFSAAGAPVAPVLFPEELIDDPQASRHYVEVEHPLSGTTRQVAPMVEMLRTPTGVQRHAPLLGEHTTEILLSLGYSLEDVVSLRERGVVLTHN